MRTLTEKECLLVSGGSPEGDSMMMVGGGMVTAGTIVSAFPHPATKIIGGTLKATGAGLVMMGKAHNSGSEQGGSGSGGSPGGPANPGSNGSGTNNPFGPPPPPREGKVEIGDFKEKD